VSLVVIVGTVVLLLGAISGAVMGWAGGPVAVLLDGVVACVVGCAHLPGGFSYVGQPGWMLFIGYYGLLGLSLLRRRIGCSVARVVLCWLLGFNVWCWASVAQYAAASRWLSVDVLDVGHGDSIVVRTPSGHTLLVDAGTAEAGRYRVLPVLRRAGIRTLDALIVTHLDDDHLGGMVPLLQELGPKRFLTNGAENDTMTFRRVQELAGRRGVSQTILQAGMEFGDGLGVDIQVLHPPAGFVPGTDPGGNENSVVMMLHKGRVRVLLTGDLEEAGLPWLLARQDELAATVLKVPHHGSALGQLGARWFRAVRPEVAMISVGRAHHLPAQHTLDTLEQLGARILLTRRDGAIRVRTDGRHLVIMTGRRGP
jgi:competence protein ComEC